MGIAGTNDEGLMAFAARQNLRLLIWAGLFAISGAGFLLQRQIGVALATDPSVIDLVATLTSFLSLAGASFSIRCPQCKLSLVWHAVTHQGIGEWLAWLLHVKVCPRCGYQCRHHDAS